MAEDNALNHAYELLQKEFEERARKLNLLRGNEAIQHYQGEIEALELELSQSLKIIKSQTAEIERLTVERDKAKRDNTSLLYGISRVEKENAELQKQVDELKEKIMNLKTAMISRVAMKSYDSMLTIPEDVEEIFGDAYESEFNKFLEQAIKDTAKEIYKCLCGHWEEMKDALLINNESEELKNLISKAIGVEVE